MVKWFRKWFDDQTVFVVLIVYGMLEALTLFAEYVGWWGDPTESHFGHGSASLVWVVLAFLWRRTSRR